MVEPRPLPAAGVTLASKHLLYPQSMLRIQQLWDVLDLSRHLQNLPPCFIGFFIINYEFCFLFFWGLEQTKSLYCDNLLISDVIVEHEIKWTKTLVCHRVSSLSDVSVKGSLTFFLFLIR